MKTRYSLITLAALCAAPALFSAASSVRLERDAPVTLRLKQALSSEAARVNDRVEFEVIEDVSAGGTVVIPKGSTAWGRVADAAPAGRMMRNGRLAVDIESVALADGGSVRLRAYGAGHPGARKPQERASGGLGARAALPFTPFQNGKGIQIPAGKLVTVYTAAPVALGSTAEPREVSARSAAPLEPSATSASVLPPVDAAPESAVAADRGMLPAPASASALPAVNAAPPSEAATNRVAPVSLPSREPVSASRGASKKLLTILAVGAAAGLAGVLAAKGHSGAQTGATAPGTTPTTVGIGQINVGGPH